MITVLFKYGRWYGSVGMASYTVGVVWGAVPMDWRGACIVPMFKGKGNRCESFNSRGIGLLSLVSKKFW